MDLGMAGRRAVVNGGSAGLGFGRAMARHHHQRHAAAHMVETLDIPVGRFGDAGDFRSVVAMICGARASDMTGQSVIIDGGATQIMF